MDKLNEIYASILKFAGLSADDEGYIFYAADDKRDPVLIDGARLVLPMQNHLRNFNPKEKMIFHPLTENIMRGESAVIKKLKQCINIRLNFVTGVVFQSLLNLVASPALHHRLSPQQAELLMMVKNADEKSVTTFVNAMVNGIRNRPESLFTSIFIRRGGVIGETKYARAGIVMFPYYRELVEGKKETVDKLRSTIDLPAWKQLFQFIFPGLDNEEEYSFGSDTNVAPNLEALMRTSANIASRLNDILETYEDYIEDSQKLMFDADWLDSFEDLEALTPEIRKVPVQHGNEGELLVREAAVAAAEQPAAMPAMTVPGQQMVTYVPTPAKPEIKTTKRGIDFQSLKQSNMAVAMTPNPLAPAMAMNAWQNAMRTNPWGAAGTMPPMAMPGAMPGMMPPMANNPWGGGVVGNMPGMMSPQPQMMSVQTPQGMMTIQVIQTPQGWAQVMPTGQLQLLPPNMQPQPTAPMSPMSMWGPR